MYLCLRHQPGLRLASLDACKTPEEVRWDHSAFPGYNHKHHIIDIRFLLIFKFRLRLINGCVYRETRMKFERFSVIAFLLKMKRWRKGKDFLSFSKGSRIHEASFIRQITIDVRIIGRGFRLDVHNLKDLPKLS